MQWNKETFGTEKPIIAMCRFQPMPGEPVLRQGRRHGEGCGLCMSGVFGLVGGRR